MGLPKITDEDIRRVFDPEVSEYLKNQTIIDIGQPQRPVLSQTNQNLAPAIHSGHTQAQNLS